MNSNKKLTSISAAAVVVSSSLLMGCQFIENVGRAVGLSDNQARAAGSAGRAVGNLVPIDLEEELEYGGAIAVMIVNTYGGLMRDRALTEYVNQVGWTVALVSERPGLRYYFGVLDSDDVQAMAAPGGYIFITRGLLRELKNEAELAGVLAHEIAHVTKKHTLDIIRNLKAKQAGLEAGGSALGNPKAFSGVVDAFLDDYLANGLPKDVEFESDLVGAEYSAAAGYDPRALKTALERIDHALHQHSDASFNKTHPEFTDRFKKLDRKLASLPKGGQVLTKRYLRHTASIR